MITAYLAERNENPRPGRLSPAAHQWKARRKEILEKIHRAREALAEAHGQLMPFEAQDARGGLLALEQHCRMIPSAGLSSDDGLAHRRGAVRI